ncbi:uncharacterized protein LOC144708880 [Wolffia australiana]
MEETGWEQRLRATTHLLSSPPAETASTSIHSQLFLAACAPSYARWDFPPFLAPLPLLPWSLSFFLSRLRHSPPSPSWRSKCPFQQPPPLFLSPAVDPPPSPPSADALRRYFRRRLRRRRPGFDLPGPVVVLIPNLLLFSLLFWDPLSLRQENL